jgi:hypothetical protein
MSAYGRPGTKAARMRQGAHELLLEREAADTLPTNGRFLFYDAEQRGLVVKLPQGRRRAVRAAGESGVAAGQDFTDALFWIRDRGLVPWWWIEDETRTLHDWHSAATVADYLLEMLELARVNPWPGDRPLILCESRSLAGVLRRLAAEYVCPCAATNGQVGGFLRTDIAPTLVDNERPVLYLGDLEPDGPGAQIEANTRNVLEDTAGRYIYWRRLAITEAQVAERGIEPLEKLDRRYRPAHPYEAWETESLLEGPLMALVREALDELLPEPLKNVREREAAEIEAQRSRLNGAAG